MTRIAIDPELVEKYILDLASHGGARGTGVWRTAYSPEWAAAQSQVEAWCHESGLATRRDAVGNVWGRLEGREGGSAIVSGSHIDSERPGGRYDGALGIVAALIAIRSLKEQFGDPRRPLEVVSFCEEEGSRFPEASCWGSRAVIGGIGPNEIESVRDRDGMPIGDAMRAIGLDPLRIADARRSDVDTFLELHIEQGPLLEEAGMAVGIVDAMAGFREYVVELEGRADHAGRPMQGRRDPMFGAAEIIAGVINNALEMGPPALTTVGRMQVEPNISSVPSKVTFSVDARHTDAGQLDELWRRHEELMRSTIEKRELTIETRLLTDIGSSPFDLELVALLETVAREQGIQTMALHSGAIHDAHLMAKLGRVGMVFVRSKDGRSHTPEEFTSAQDAADGIRVLAAALYELAYG